MYFEIDVLTRHDQERNFSLYLDEQQFELGLDTITAIVNKGDRLLGVTLVFEKSVLKLPVSIFDGHGFCQPMTLLKEQWQISLN